jgi:D-proline reductase (dithiol) PrdB
VDTQDLRFAHDHYDHTDADQDPNCVFPLDRLRELAAEGVIGSVAAGHVGFMGFVPNPTRLVDETIPEVAARLNRDKVDAIVFSPG